MPVHIRQTTEVKKLATPGTVLILLFHLAMTHESTSSILSEGTLSEAIADAITPAPAPRSFSKVFPWMLTSYLNRQVMSAAQDLGTWFMVAAMFLFVFFGTAFMLGLVSLSWVNPELSSPFGALLLGITELIGVISVIHWTAVFVWVRTRNK